MLETLNEALAVADILLVENSGSGVNYELGWKGKTSTLWKHK